MTFNVCFIYAETEEIVEVGAMTIAEAKEFIAMMRATTLACGDTYSDHYFSISDKTFYIEVV
jgi:hypothetical protein